MKVSAVTTFRQPPFRIYMYITFAYACKKGVLLTELTKLTKHGFVVVKQVDLRKMGAKHNDSKCL